MIRREAIEATGGWEESFRGMHDDQAFYAKLCIDKAVYVSSTCSYYYRKHEGSMCLAAVASGRYYDIRWGFLNWLKNYLAKKKIQNDGVWRALKYERRVLWHQRHPGISHGLQTAERLLKGIGRRIIPPRLRSRLRTLLRNDPQSLARPQ